ncbi:MAG TPA: cupredoxin domain-containing protein, partial [Thermomicrobiales bacterium]|nr:cupredoxin domain-containing protein [Thermomicrobiales bacterium]
VSPGEQFDAPPTHATTKVAPATPTADGKVDVTLKEFSVASSAASFKVGQAYTFTVTNNGQYAHQMEIEPAGAMDQPLTNNGQQAKIASIDPGKSQTLTWTFAKPGVYQIACHLMDHYAKGMVVTIHVAS